MSLLGEIKRRKVFQVAAVYLVVAWLIMQVVDVVNEPLSLPNWFDTVAILIVAIGFPIALIVSWAFDLTPEGMVRDQGTNVVAQSSGRRMEYVFAGLLVVAVATLLYREFSPAGSGGDRGAELLPNSVAVLPFDNLSPDPENAYFAAGIHEAVLNELAKIADITVIARTSMLRYEDSPRSIPEIADELRVETVMEGSVQYAEGRVLVTAQLIDPATNAHIWSENYDREFAGIFEIQADIATRIAMALEAELTPSELRNIERAPTESPEAYAFYLQALAVYGISTGISISSEESAAFHRHLDEAIAIDPDFALAYAAKARDYAYAMVRDRRLTEPTTVEDLEQVARENAGRALALDLNLGLAYVALALTNRFNRRWEDARSAYERALELSPNDPNVIFDFAVFNRTIGRHDEALRLAEQLVDISPGLGHWSLSFILADGGDYDGSVDAARAGLELYPDSAQLYFNLGEAEAKRGNNDAALTALRRAEELSFAGTVGNHVDLLESYSSVGSQEDVERLFVETQALSNEFHMGPGLWATAYLGLRNREQTLEWLNIAADNPAPTNDYVQRYELAGNFLANPILDEPEFVEVRSRLGFKQ